MESFFEDVLFSGFSFYFRRKPKAKAPLPPAEMKGMGVPSAEEPVDSTAAIMEQNENMIDKDIDLSVVLPGDILKSATVPGRYAAVVQTPQPRFFCHH